MPKLLQDNDLDVHDISGSYGYSGERLEKLAAGASGYTVVAVAQDESPSVGGFKTEMENTLKAIVAACRDSARKDNLLLRLTAFAHDLREIHGFKLLEACDPDSYDDCLICHGMTSLFEATDEAIVTLGDYSTKLYNQELDVNGIVFIITDGLNNVNRSATPATIKANLARLVQEEMVESVVTVLVGVNVADPSVRQALEDFKAEAGLSAFVAIDEADAKSLAKLADFVSQSISDQSDSLCSGGPSVPLSLTI